MRPECAAPVAALCLNEFKAALDRFVEEGRRDRAIFLDFRMAIIGKGRAEANRVEEPATGVDFGAQIGTILLDLKADLFGLDSGVERITHRYAIQAVIMAERRANRAAVEDQRRSACHFPCFCSTVRQLATQGRQIGNVGVCARRSNSAQRCREDEIARVEIACLGVAAVEMDNKFVAERHIDLAKARTLF